MLTFDEMRDGPLNVNFDQAGFKSMQAIKNLGSTYLFLMVDAVTLVVIGLAWGIKRFMPK
jgi:flagellar biogenesis protein FliO